MSYLKLLKLLYFCDRRALAQLGRPISGDMFVCMDKGPVLSNTLNLIREERAPEEPSSYWRTYISEPTNYEVELLREAPADQLSPAEESIIDSVFAELGRKSRWELVDLCHTLPEYRDPGGSSTVIQLRDILVGQGMSVKDAKAVERELAASAAADDLT